MARLFTPADSRPLSLPGRRSREILAGASGAERATMRLVEIDPIGPDGPRRGPHVHLDFEECIYVLEGEGLTCTETGEYPISAGDTMLIPANEKHATYNTGTTVLKLLCFFPVGDIKPSTIEFESWETSPEAE